MCLWWNINRSGIWRSSKIDSDLWSERNVGEVSASSIKHRRWHRSTLLKINHQQGNATKMTTITQAWAWNTSLSITITMINNLSLMQIQITMISTITHNLLLVLVLELPPPTPTLFPPSNPLPPMTPPSPPTDQSSQNHLKCKRKDMQDVNGDGDIYFHFKPFYYSATTSPWFRFAMQENLCELDWDKLVERVI